jgi:hypothetical protein
MRDTLTLTVTSLVTIVMLVLHLTIEIVHGVEPGNVSTYIGVLILAVWMAGALTLADRRSGLIIMLLGGIAAAGVSILHMRGAGLVGGRIGQTSDAFLWVATLLTFSVTGTFSVLLAGTRLVRRPRSA